MGFGGGHLYCAAGFKYHPGEVIPLIALPCNIAVVSVGSYLAVHRRDFRLAAVRTVFCNLCPHGICRWLDPDATVIFYSGLEPAIAGVSLIVRTAPDVQRSREHVVGVGQCHRGRLGLLPGMVV